MSNPFYFSVYNFPQTHLFPPPIQLTFYSIFWLFPLVWSPSLYPLIWWHSNRQVSIAKLRYSIRWFHNISLPYIFFSLIFASQSSLSLLYYLLYIQIKAFIPYTPTPLSLLSIFQVAPFSCLMAKIFFTWESLGSSVSEATYSWFPLGGDFKMVRSSLA